MSESSASETTTEEFFAGLLTPAKDRLKIVRSKRNKVERELDRLRDEEKIIVRGIRAWEPTFERNGKPGPKPTTGSQISETRVTAVREFLLAHKEELNETFPEGFTASDVKRQPGAPEYAPDSILVAIRRLHDRGVVRLNKRGRGGAKMWVIV